MQDFSQGGPRPLQEGVKPLQFKKNLKIPLKLVGVGLGRGSPGRSPLHSYWYPFWTHATSCDISFTFLKYTSYAGGNLFHGQK